MEQTFSPAIEKAADQLNLNLWGKISLTIFCDGAIDHGLKQCALFKDAKDPYRYFMTQAKSYSNAEKIALRWARCYELQEKHNMPDGTDVFVNEPVIKKPEPTKFYTHKEENLDYNADMRIWHEMVMNWDKIGDDPKNYALPRRQKKCIKGYELTRPGYIEWLKKQDLTTFLDSNPPDVLVYMDESKLTLLDAMRAK